jgi:hypothetical protein
MCTYYSIVALLCLVRCPTQHLLHLTTKLQELRIYCIKHHFTSKVSYFFDNSPAKLRLKPTNLMGRRSLQICKEKNQCSSAFICIQNHDTFVKNIVPRRWGTPTALRLAAYHISGSGTTSLPTVQACHFRQYHPVANDRGTRPTPKNKAPFTRHRREGANLFFHQPPPNGQGYRLPPRFHPQLAVDIFQVITYCSLGDPQRLADFQVASSPRQQSHHLPLPRRQR